jgi:hypothetical protein
MQKPGDGEWKKGLLGRLGFYAVGLAIGFVMLGFFNAAKKKEAADREARRARQQQVVPGPPPAPDSAPAQVKPAP